jgi:hypothetical protein
VTAVTPENHPQRKFRYTLDTPVHRGKNNHLPLSRVEKYSKGENKGNEKGYFEEISRKNVT